MKAFVVSLMSGALLLPATATSLSGQVRVELDGWWRSDAHAQADARVTYEDGYRSRGGRVSVDSYRRLPRFPNGGERASGQRTDAGLRVDRAHRRGDSAINSIATEVCDLGGRLGRKARGCRQGDLVYRCGHIRSGRFCELPGQIPFYLKMND